MCLWRVFSANEVIYPTPCWAQLKQVDTISMFGKTGLLPCGLPKILLQEVTRNNIQWIAMTSHKFGCPSLRLYLVRGNYVLLAYASVGDILLGVPSCQMQLSRAFALMWRFFRWPTDTWWFVRCSFWAFGRLQPPILYRKKILNSFAINCPPSLLLKIRL